MNKNKLLLGAAVFALCAGGIQSAHATTDTLTIEALVVQAITVDCSISNLDFGNLDSTLAGTVTVSTAGARSDTNAGGNLVGGGSPSAGRCAIDGEDGLVVDVNIPDDSITNGTDTLTIDNYTFAGSGSGGAGPNDYTITLPAGAAANYDIGGDLTFAGGESAGSYTGSVVVTVTYQ